MKAEYNESNRVQIAVYMPRIELIQRVVCEYFGIPIEQSQEHGRQGTSIRARRRIHYLCRLFIRSCPLSVIGLLTGNGRAFDHSSISHSYRETWRELNFKNRAGELVYPDVQEELLIMSARINREMEKMRMASDVKICDHCQQPLINIEP